MSPEHIYSTETKQQPTADSSRQAEHGLLDSEIGAAWRSEGLAASREHLTLPVTLSQVCTH